MQEEQPDYYAILQVHLDAQQEVIEAAYRRLVRIYHPDVNPSLDANQKMAALNEAYAVLSNQELRAAYDAERETENLPWEDDQEFRAEVFSVKAEETRRFWATPPGAVLRWIAVLPLGIGAAIVVMFPIHWSILLADSLFFGGNGRFFGLLSSETFEQLMVSWSTPFTVITCGAWVAPTRRFETGIALALLIAVLLGGVYVLAVERGSGLYSLYYGATPVLNLVGVVAGLIFVREYLLRDKDASGAKADWWTP